MTNILLALVDGSTYSKSVCDHAAWAAARMDAEVDLLHVLDRQPGAGKSDLSGSLRWVPAPPCSKSCLHLMSNAPSCSVRRAAPFSTMPAPLSRRPARRLPALTCAWAKSSTR
jgi:nucleotide-binding universal stress UspA family protein